MKLSELVLLIVFVGILVAGGILLPFYFTYQAILYTGFFSIQSLLLIALTTITSYSVVTFLKENWERLDKPFSILYNKSIKKSNKNFLLEISIKHLTNKSKCFILRM